MQTGTSQKRGRRAMLALFARRLHPRAGCKADKYVEADMQTFHMQIGGRRVRPQTRAICKQFVIPLGGARCHDMHQLR
jgi:hypothetical protein